MNEEIPYNPPGMAEHIMRGAAKNAALIAKMQGKPAPAQSEAAKADSLQRVVRWPAFAIIWSTIFGTSAAILWALGIGTPTIQAAATGFHVAVILLVIPQLRPSNAEVSDSRK